MNNIKYAKIKKAKLSEITNSIFDNLSRDIKYEIISEYISDNQNHMVDIHFSKYEDLKSFRVNLRDFIDNSNEYLLLEIFNGSFEIYKTFISNCSNYETKTVVDYIGKLKDVFYYNDEYFNDFFEIFDGLISIETPLLSLNKKQELLLLFINWYAAIRHHQINKYVVVTLYTEYMSDEEVNVTREIGNIILQKNVFDNIIFLTLT